MTRDEAFITFLMVFMQHGTKGFTRNEAAKLRELLSLQRFPLKKTDWESVNTTFAAIMQRASHKGTVRNLLLEAALVLTNEITGGEKYRFKAALREIALAKGGIAERDIGVIKLFDEFVAAKD